MTQRWRWQEEAYQFALTRRGTLLHMKMGQGKSKVAIDLASTWRSKRVLVLCPASVIDVWTREQFPRHLDRAAYPLAVAHRRIGKGTADDAAMLAAMHKGTTLPLAYVCNYDSAWRGKLGAALRGIPWDLVVLDESHRIKAPWGKASRFVGRLCVDVTHVLGLSGTPMPHSPLDIFGQARAISPATFGPSFVQHRSRYARIVNMPGGYPKIIGWQNQQELAARMASFTFSCTEDVLGLEEPLHERRLVTLLPQARRVYHDLERVLRAEVAEGALTIANAATRALRLQQVTGGTMPTDDGPAVRVDYSKQKALVDLLEDADEPWVVVCRFHADLDAVRSAGEAAGRVVVEHSGRDHGGVRQWKAGKADVLALQIQSGREGIDLTRARYCCIYSLTYSNGDYDQVLARLQRPGQTRQVTYYHLIAAGTVDERVYDALRNKRSVVETVLDYLKQPAALAAH